MALAHPDPFCFHLYFVTPGASVAPFVMRMAEDFKTITKDLVGMPRLCTFSNASAPAVLHVCFRYGGGELALLQQLEVAIAWMKAQPQTGMYKFNVATISLSKGELLVEAEQVDSNGPLWTTRSALYVWDMNERGVGGSDNDAQLLDWAQFCTQGCGDMRTLFSHVARTHVIEQPRSEVEAAHDSPDLIGGDMSCFLHLLSRIDTQHVEDDGDHAPLFLNFFAPFAPLEELRVGDWVAYINADTAWRVVCTQITGFDFSRPCTLTLQNMEHLVKTKDEELAFARFDPTTNSLTSRLAPVSAFRLVY